MNSENGQAVRHRDGTWLTEQQFADTKDALPGEQNPASL
jgi:hypothetical protein